MRRNILISLIGGMTVVSMALAQPPTTYWMQTFGGSGGDHGRGLGLTADGGYIITGFTGSYGAGERDVWLIKTDIDGNEEWNYTFGGSQTDLGWDVIQTADGGYIITGETNSMGAGYDDMYVIKTDSSGNLLWDSTYGGSGNDFGYSVLQTTNGSYIFGAATYSYGSGWVDMWLVKTDSAGNQLWQQTFGTPGWDRCYDVEHTSDGGYILAGYYEGYDARLVKTDSMGVAEWGYSYGGSGDDKFNAVQQTADGGYICGGQTTTYGAGANDCYLVKTDSLGNQEWYATFGGSGQDYGVSARQTSDGGYIFTGLTGSFGAGGTDGWVIKTDNYGNEEWNLLFGDTGNDTLRRVCEVSEGEYILMGTTDSYGAGGPDVWLLHLSSEPGPLPITVTLTPYNPPIVIPSGGGSFDFNIEVTNDENYSLLIDFWVNIETPGGYDFTVIGPIYSYPVLAGTSINRDRSLYVPGYAPGGEYACKGFAGNYPWIVYDVDTFTFSKEGADGIWTGSEGWICTGEPFPGETLPDEALPHESMLLNPYPNPFNPTTTLRFSLPEAARVKLEVFDISGRLVGARHASPLLDRWMDAGYHEVTFDGSNLASGLYIARLQAGGYIASQKMVLMK